MTEQLGFPRVQALHDAYGGWLDKQSVADFAEYAEVVFKALGHRVTNWSTFNEPWTFVEVRQGQRRCWCWVLRPAAGTLGLRNHVLGVPLVDKRSNICHQLHDLADAWSLCASGHCEFAVIWCADHTGQQFMQEAGTSDLCSPLSPLQRCAATL